MTPARAFGLLAPVTFGSALVWIGMIARPASEPREPDNPKPSAASAPTQSPAFAVALGSPLAIPPAAAPLAPEVVATAVASQAGRSLAPDMDFRRNEAALRPLLEGATDRIGPASETAAENAQLVLLGPALRAIAVSLPELREERPETASLTPDPPPTPVMDPGPAQSEEALAVQLIAAPVPQQPEAAPLPAAVQSEPTAPGAFPALAQAPQQPAAPIPAPAPAVTTPASPAAAMATSAVALPAGATSGQLPEAQALSLAPGRQTFPAAGDAGEFSYDDELILNLKVRGIDATDTIVAYGTRDGVFLPLGELSVILDLAIRVSDEGHFASGWFLDEDRQLTIDLRQGLIETNDGERPLPRGLAQAFDGELYVRADLLSSILPLDLEPDLRAQAVLLTTREPFPFEERLKREADRARLELAGTRGTVRESWPREEAPWLALSAPLADVEMRAVSDSTRGTRAEGDLRLAGDLAYMTAEAYLSATSRDGLVASLLQLGRRDPEGDLLGPLGATEFALGDVSTVAMPVGLRGVSGRGAFVTNKGFGAYSVFDRIDLRGVLPDGYEVELYRNGILVGSSAEAVNGQYEFLQVPVDYGTNVFRIVFFGPQGQRREEVRRISVGDGRLPVGEIEYSMGLVQVGSNVLGVTAPDFRPGDRYGDWQAVGEVSYGIASALTATASAAFYEDEGESRWLAGAGLRTGLAGLSLRADAALGTGGSSAAGIGLGGAALGGAFTLSHFEYGGGFIDEAHSFGSDPLRRASELDFNSSIGLGAGPFVGSMPINLRARRIEYANGRSQLATSLRASVRTPGLIASNSLEYSHTASPGTESFSQLVGDFNLATFSRSSTQVRAGLGYRVAPKLELLQVSGSIDHALDEATVISASAGYSFANEDISFGASAIREFSKFTLALDGQYTPGLGTYSAALRIGLSFGRDPLRQSIYLAPPGQASSGVAALRAFRDLDGDLLFGEDDEPLPGVEFAATNAAATTDERGFARLGKLGNGNPVVVQVDVASLPDIAMAPASRGIEIVPRAGRVQVLDFPIVEMSDLEGEVLFVDGNSQRGVSGLRLQLRGADEEHQYWSRTERGGYYFFEQVMPGSYELILDEEQANRLGVCLTQPVKITVAPKGDFLARNLSVQRCDEGNATP